MFRLFSNTHIQAVTKRVEKKLASTIQYALCVILSQLKSVFSSSEENNKHVTIGDKAQQQQKSISQSVKFGNNLHPSDGYDICYLHGCTRT